MGVEKINKERYNQIMENVYKAYANSHNKFVDGFIHTIPMAHSKESFVETIKTDGEFAKRWGVKITERELTLEERYNKWFNNNYETGMERYFDPNNLPDFDNEYYYQTPTKELTLEYKEKKVSYYE